MALKVNSSKYGIRFAVKVVPGSSRTAIKGLLDHALKINLAAPPEKGKANKAIGQLLCKKLRLRGRQLTMISGETSADKRFLVTEISRDELRLRISKALDED